MQVDCFLPNPTSASTNTPTGTFIDCTNNADSINSKEGFHFIPNTLDQRIPNDWTDNLKKFLARKKNFVLQILKAGTNVLKWTGKEFANNTNAVLFRLNLAKVRGHIMTDIAFMKLSIPILEASMVMNVNIDDQFYWTPETEIQEQLKSAVSTIDKRFQQIKSQIK